MILIPYQDCWGHSATMTPDGDGVSQLTGKEENELLDKEENTTKQEKIENEEAKKSVSKEKVEVEVSENDKTAVDSKDKGRFLQSEIFKNIFCSKILKVIRRLSIFWLCRHLVSLSNFPLHCVMIPYSLP